MTDMMVRTVRQMRAVQVPGNITSIQAFLTYDCNYKCGHCTNDLVARRTPQALLTADQWVEGLDRLEGGAPVTIRGGEPSLHPGFMEIVERMPAKIRMRIVTNLSFDVTELMGRVDAERLNADSGWAPICATFHAGKSDAEEMLAKVMMLEEAGYRVGLLGMAGPEEEEGLRRTQKWFLSWGVDFRVRAFVGYADGILMGDFGYPDASGQNATRPAACRTSEMSIAPDGRVYRCRRDTFAESGAVGHLLDGELKLAGRHTPCRNYGVCHPCDVERRAKEFGGEPKTVMEILPLD